MRQLSRAEVLTIQGLVAEDPARSDRLDRMRGVPRTTFQTIRSRALANGWIKERYIPHPFALGFDEIVVGLGQPFAENWRWAVGELKRDERTVVFWASQETVFWVSYGSSESDVPALEKLRERCRRLWIVRCHPTPQSLISYFDYEGLWSRWACGENPHSYPRGMQVGSESIGMEPSRLTPRLMPLLGRLVRRPFDGVSSTSVGSMLSLLRLPRAERLLVERGFVVRRIMPDLFEIPAVMGRRLGSVMFVSGLLNARAPGSEVFNDLASRTRTTPFVFAADQRRILMVGAAPDSRDSSLPPSGLLAALRNWIHDIEVVREPIGSMLIVIDHRYDRLVSDQQGL
jgi:hypothetical protein